MLGGLFFICNHYQGIICNAFSLIPRTKPEQRDWAAAFLFGLIAIFTVNLWRTFKPYFFSFYPVSPFLANACCYWIYHLLCSCCKRVPFLTLKVNIIICNWFSWSNSRGRDYKICTIPSPGQRATKMRVINYTSGDRVSCVEYLGHRHVASLGSGYPLVRFITYGLGCLIETQQVT